MMLLLPTPINRVRLRILWLILSVASAVLVTLVVGATRRWGSLDALGWGALVLVVLALPGLVWPYRVQWVYRGWNYAARVVGRLVERYVTAVGFLTVLLPLSWTSRPPRFERSPGPGTMWRERSSQGREAYVSQYDDPSVGGPDATWLQAFRAWARRSGHGHAVVLLPFLWLLRVSAPSGGDGATTPTNIYTLY